MNYSSNEPARTEIDALTGPTVIEFGSNTCGYCMAAQPLVSQAFSGHDAVRHIKVQDGKGRPLGRSFGVKLWPTLVFMKDGKEMARVVRPSDVETIQGALDAIVR